MQKNQKFPNQKTRSVHSITEILEPAKFKDTEKAENPTTDTDPTSPLTLTTTHFK